VIGVAKRTCTPATGPHGSYPWRATSFYRHEKGFSVNTATAMSSPADSWAPVTRLPESTDIPTDSVCHNSERKLVRITL
jgi:hypothetical protein